MKMLGNRLARTALGIGFACLAGVVCGDGLPEGYRQLDYIRGDGMRAYIVTDYVPVPSTDRLEFECALVTKTRNAIPFYALGKSLRWNLLYLQTTIRYDYNNNVRGNFSAMPAIGQFVRFVFASGKAEWYDGETLGGSVTVSEASDGSVGVPLEMFSTSGLGNFSDHMLRSFKVYRNNDLIHDYVPAMRLVDGVIGLYDTQVAGGQFWTTVAGGAFTGGETSAGSQLVVSPIDPQDCTGAPVHPTVIVKNTSGATLAADSDYTVSYGANTDAGLGSVTVTGSGAYAGQTATAYFRLIGNARWISTGRRAINSISGDGEASYVQTDVYLTPKDEKIVAKFMLDGLDRNSVIWWGRNGLGRAVWYDAASSQFKCYNGTTASSFGTGISPDVTYVLTENGGNVSTSPDVGGLTEAGAERTDRPIAFFASTSGGTLANYSTTKIFSFTVEHDNARYAEFLPCRKVVEGAQPVFGFYDAIGDKFYGNSGSGELRADYADFLIDPIHVQTCTGRMVCPPVRVMDAVDGSVLERGRDYTVRYSDNVNHGKGIVTVTGRGVYEGKEATVDFLLRGTHEFFSRDYQIVEYVQGDGVQQADNTGAFVQLDYVPRPAGDELDIRFALTNLTANAVIWWPYLSQNGSSWDMIFLPSKNGFRFDYGSTQNVISKEGFSPGDCYNLHVADNKATIEGLGEATATLGSAFYCNSVVLFKTSAFNGEGNYSTTRIYSFMAKRGGVVICDLVPCRRLSDGAVGFFDLANTDYGKFFGNADTEAPCGELIAGPDVKTKRTGMAIFLY